MKTKDFKAASLRCVLALVILLTAITALSAQESKDYSGNLDNKKFKVIDNTLFDCIYEYKIATKDKEGEPVTEIYNTILQVGSSRAKFWDYAAFANDSIQYFADDASSDIKKEYENRIYKSNFFEPTIYQNEPKGKITVNDVMTNYFTYTEGKDTFKWSLSSDTLTICGNLCKKATTTYGGREWSVWYTTAIPSAYGPWKLSGLPGLILLAHDSENIHTFSAISIRQNSVPIYSDINFQRIKTNREKFIANKNNFEVDPMSSIQMESISNITINRFGENRAMFINGVQVRIRPNGYTPLEVE